MIENTVLRVKDLMDAFHLVQECGDEDSIMRRILVPDINRPGLELTGYYIHSDKKRIVILGDKEISYIGTMPAEDQRKHFDFLTSDETPVIIVSKNHPVPRILREVAEKKNFPIFGSKLSTVRVTVEVIAFLENFLAPSSSLHGTLMNVYGTGVLIMGDSGVGKSELALELIRRDHVLIADDRVVTYNMHNRVVGKSPKILEGVLEVRGIGIINVMHMFGASSILDSINIDVVIYLEHYDGKKEYDRLGDKVHSYMNILGIDIPKIEFPVKVGRNMAVLVETAVTNFKLKQRGINSATEFNDRVMAHLEEKQKRMVEESKLDAKKVDR
ncbi:MAG: HPr(Ser) kinase/phosphatase [Erysipelothrix sp.]|nr:HPr(Ser) kinase/phosphatase [Erysipelothrix sp.]